MSRKNFKMETAKDGQTIKQDSKHAFTMNNVAKKDNTPTGKVKTLKDAKQRREAREKQYREFRINALKRRAKRMNVPEEEIPKLVEKLIAQLDSPKEYSILITFDKNDGKMFHEALKEAKINYKFHGDNFFSIHGNQDVLAKIREIAPASAKIHPYAIKAEPILKPSKSKTESKPTNNTAKAKKRAQKARKQRNLTNFANRKKGRGKKASKTAKIYSLRNRKKDVKSIKKAA